jgi:hypothetical protein
MIQFLIGFALGYLANTEFGKKWLKKAKDYFLRGKYKN